MIGCRRLVLVVGASLVFAVSGSAEAAELVRDAYPRLTDGALAQAEVGETPTGVILRSGQIRITQKDLNAEIRKSPKDVWGQLKRNLFYVLENKATEMFLDHEASEWAKKNKRSEKKGSDELVEAYLSSLTAKLAVSDGELKSFYDENKSMMGGASFDKVKDQLKDYLLGQKREAAIRKHIASIGGRYEIAVDKTWTAKQYAAAMDNPVDKARQSGKVTMVDFGADGCRPCEMMTPILSSLRKEYAGKANILFVHVRKEQILGARYGVRAIPVQVFFDKSGREVFRHVGFFAKNPIVAKLAEMGVK